MTGNAKAAESAGSSAIGLGRQVPAVTISGMAEVCRSSAIDCPAIAQSRLA
jgi:hypothetical protein